MNRRSVLKMLGGLPFVKAIGKPEAPKLPANVDEELDLWGTPFPDRRLYIYSNWASFPLMTAEELKRREEEE